ncbi:hypothetical protein DRN86_01055 [Candidatus Geothermarchaeota archaeon]|nr:MAG: hypothetical protein DRN86_01055 [Candidatus Geothermarchaeota archaeon]
MDELANDILNLGLKIATPFRNGTPPQSILSVRAPNVNEVHKRLLNEKIVVSARSGLLRISPHFYNRKEDIERFLSKVKVLIRSNFT